MLSGWCDMPNRIVALRQDQKRAQTSPRRLLLIHLRFFKKPSLWFDGSESTCKSATCKFPRLEFVSFGKTGANPLEFPPICGYQIDMSSTTEEIIRVCEALPADKQSELADFARFLLARQDDEAWERRLAYPRARPRLDAFLRDSAAEGDEPLDPHRL